MPEARDGQSYIFTGWSLDGANVTNFELGGTLVLPNVDAIQEFTVLSGNMPPEFGHTPNMVVASLKSGTNSFHGTVFVPAQRRIRCPELFPRRASR